MERFAWKGKLRNWLPQYRENLTLAVPVMLSQVGQVVVQLADNAMVGRLGALPLAGVSFGGAVFVIFMFWGMGVSLGLTPLVGEAYAKRDLRGAAALFQNSLVLYAATGIVLLALLLGLEALMDRMGQAPEVVAQARPYFRYLSWSIVPFMMYCAFKQFLEGVGNTSAAMVVMLTSNAINIGFNYLLIYGKCGFPEMGAAGAGLATLISRICMPLMMLAYFLRDVSFRRYLRFFTWAAQGWRRIRQLLSVGLPISVQMVLEVSAFALSSIMMGWIGAVELAAHQIVVTFGNFAFMAMVGISSATTILVSHRFGRGDLDGLTRRRDRFVPSGADDQFPHDVLLYRAATLDSAAFHLRHGRRGGCRAAFHHGRALSVLGRFASRAARRAEGDAGCEDRDAVRFRVVHRHQSAGRLSLRVHARHGGSGAVDRVYLRSRRGRASLLAALSPADPPDMGRGRIDRVFRCATRRSGRSGSFQRRFRRKIVVRLRFPAVSVGVEVRVVRVPSVSAGGGYFRSVPHRSA